MRDRLTSVDWQTVRHLLWRGANLVGLLVLLVVVFAFAVFAVPQLVGGEHSYIVLSGSMEPTMEPGDVVLVDEVDIDAIESGDIVSFRDGSGSVTTHRVVDRITDGELALRTKGDANEEPDQGLVGDEPLIGRVMTVGETPVVIPYVGLVIEATQSDLGVYALLFVPLTLLLLNEVYIRLGSSSAATATGGEEARPSHLLATNGGDDHPALAHARVEGVAALGGPGGAALGAGADDGSVDGPVQAGTEPRPLTLTPLLLLFAVPYGGWLALTTGSIPAAVLAAGAVVALLPLAYTRARRWRNDDAAPHAAALSRLDLTLATLSIAIVVPVSAWVALQEVTVPAAMVAAGGAVAFVLLALARLRLWWIDRGRTGDDAEVSES